MQVHPLFFWSRSLVVLNKSRILVSKSRILLNKSRILILHPHFSGPFGANAYSIIYIILQFHGKNIPDEFKLVCTCHCCNCQRFFFSKSILSAAFVSLHSNLYFFYVYSFILAVKCSYFQNTTI